MPVLDEMPVLIETFALTPYGMIGGKVIELSGDATIVRRGNRTGRPAMRRIAMMTATTATARYVADISLERNYMDTETERVALTPGMAVTAEIYTGRRSIISFLLSSVRKLVEEAGHER